MSPRMMCARPWPNSASCALATCASRMLPGRKIGRPEDIANAVSFLISDSLVTGTVLHAEGAQLLV
jgi:NAD(P)-dependent dehydrogenase (short-subunit alcohol dehydrogenase family)